MEIGAGGPGSGPWDVPSVPLVLSGWKKYPMISTVSKPVARNRG